MTTMTVQLRSIPDTKAALGCAEGHTIVVDRKHRSTRMRIWVPWSRAQRTFRRSVIRSGAPFRCR